MRSERLAKIAFALSAALLIWLYGFATSARQWFPNDLLVTAWRQARAIAPTDILGPHHWVHDRVYERHGARTAKPDSVHPGLTMIVSRWRSEGSGWLPGLRLVDRERRTLHRWRVDATEIFTSETRSRWGRWKNTSDIELRHRGLIGSHLFEDGDVLVNVEHVGTIRLDACGEVVWRLPAGNHHSIERADDGSFWIPGGKYNVPAETPAHPDGLPGLSGPIHQDLLVHVSSDGEILDTINVLDVLYENGLERRMVKSGVVGKKDLTHLNDVEPLSASMADKYPLFKAGDLVVSLSFLDLVLVVDPESRRVKWHASDPFIHQHDPDFIGNGWIGVFDNNRDETDRGTMLGGSRVVAVQPHTDSTRVLFPGPEAEPFYTAAVGQWQQLENGNLLLTESYPGRVVEVGPDGGTVWEWIHAPYDEPHVPGVTGATRYDLTPEEVASWPCSPGEAPPETTEQEVDA